MMFFGLVSVATAFIVPAPSAPVANSPYANEISGYAPPTYTVPMMAQPAPQPVVSQQAVLAALCGVGVARKGAAFAVAGQRAPAVKGARFAAPQMQVEGAFSQVGTYAGGVAPSRGMGGVDPGTILVQGGSL